MSSKQLYIAGSMQFIVGSWFLLIQAHSLSEAAPILCYIVGSVLFLAGSIKGANK